MSLYDSRLIGKVKTNRTYPARFALIRMSRECAASLRELPKLRDLLEKLWDLAVPHLVPMQRKASNFGVISLAHPQRARAELSHVARVRTPTGQVLYLSSAACINSNLEPIRHFSSCTSYHGISLLVVGTLHRPSLELYTICILLFIVFTAHFLSSENIRFETCSAQ